MDKRKHYVLVLDTETANTLITADGKMDMSDVLVYDCGFAVVDTSGTVYETHSYINSDIFIGNQDLMQSAYYGWKVPRYIEGIESGKHILANTYQIRDAMLSVIEKYGITEVVAHNARFDSNALNVTQRYTTASKYRYWFPFERIEFWDTMKMAEDVILPKPSYIAFCERNGYLLPNGRPRKTAEILYRFISGDNEFEEEHTGLEDVLIEAQIMWYCFRQHKPMRKSLYDTKKEYPVHTPFQRELMTNLKQIPTLRMV